MNFSFLRSLVRVQSRAFKRFAAAIALVAVVLHAFAPMATHAMMAKSGKSFVEICTAKGFTTIEIDESGKSTPGIKIDHQCALCALASQPPCPLLPADFVFQPLANSSMVALSSSTFAFANVLQRNHPPTGPPIL